MSLQLKVRPPKSQYLDAKANIWTCASNSPFIANQLVSPASSGQYAKTPPLFDGRRSTKEMTSHTTSSLCFNSVVDALASTGLDTSQLLAGAGIDPGSLKNASIRYHTDQLSLLWEMAALYSGNPAIGLLQDPNSRVFDFITYNMSTCSNLLAAIKYVREYLPIVCDAVTLDLHETDRGHWVSMEIAAGIRPIPRQRVEFLMLRMLNIIRKLSKGNTHSLAVQLTAPPPADKQAYFEAFQCPIHFDSQQNGLYLSHADLQAPLASVPPRETLQETTPQKSKPTLDSMTERVRKLLITRASNSTLQRAEIAGVLHVSERTLQRRLQMEGASFQQLLDDTRSALAREYLQQPHLALDQVAHLLGFSDQSTFTRACRRWLGVAPGQYRQQAKETPNS